MRHRRPPRPPPKVGPETATTCCMRGRLRPVTRLRGTRATGCHRAVHCRSSKKSCARRDQAGVFAGAGGSASLLYGWHLVGVDFGERRLRRSARSASPKFRPRPLMCVCVLDALPTASGSEQRNLDHLAPGPDLSPAPIVVATSGLLIVGMPGERPARRKRSAPVNSRPARRQAPALATASCRQLRHRMASRAGDRGRPSYGRQSFRLSPGHQLDAKRRRPCSISSAAPPGRVLCERVAPQAGPSSGRNT